MYIILCRGKKSPLSQNGVVENPTYDCRNKLSNVNTSYVFLTVGFPGERGGRSVYYRSFAGRDLPWWCRGGAYRGGAVGGPEQHLARQRGGGEGDGRGGGEGRRRPPAHRGGEGGGEGGGGAAVSWEGEMWLFVGSRKIFVLL